MVILQKFGTVSSFQIFLDNINVCWFAHFMAFFNFAHFFNWITTSIFPTHWCHHEIWPKPTEDWGAEGGSCLVWPLTPCSWCRYQVPLSFGHQCMCMWRAQLAKMHMCCIFSLLRSLGACLAFKCIDFTPRLPNAITICLCPPHLPLFCVNWTAGYSERIECFMFCFLVRYSGPIWHLSRTMFPLSRDPIPSVTLLPNLLITIFVPRTHIHLHAVKC